MERNEFLTDDMARGIFDGISLVVWDWNGTLLDDVRINMDTINDLLTRRGVVNIQNLNEYRSGFGFPIIDYYRGLGFDTKREAFSDIADEYVRVYSEKLCEAGLYSGVRDALEHVSGLGIRQVIISAAEGDRLRREVRNYGIDGYFTDVIGTGDNLGSSKVSLALNFVGGCGVERDHVLFIGDLLHDAEVAGECGCRAVLVSAGHQTGERLKVSGYPVFSDLNALLIK